MSVIGLKFGEHIADIIIQKRRIQPKAYHIVERPFKLNEFTVPDFICLGSGIASVILVVFLSSIVQENRNILFAAVFAYIGIIHNLIIKILVDYNNFFFLL